MPHTTTPTPEILAPAGDRESLLAALKGGADAVYLGIRDFNARWGATNFELEELEDAIDLAHSHDTKVFLALNIPIKQDEIQDALDIIDSAYSFGIDAIIMEDLGLLRIIRETYPDLKLHASTQMTIHNTAGAQFVEDIGADRVILSRELDTTELKNIIDNTGIEAEVFVHGALCYAYSGRCLFSSFISGRSANRGACTQPCRLRYRFIVDGLDVDNSKIGIGEYPISNAELCTLPQIDEIVNTGVVSLKIEGRMKRGEYVTKSASAYKSAVEKLKSNGYLDKDEIETDQKELTKLFYRGFTKGFMLGESDVTHPKYSSNYGLFLGKVSDIADFRYTTSLKVKLREDFNAKDGIGIQTRTRMLGSAVNVLKIGEERVESAKAGDDVILEISSKTGKSVDIGDELYITTDRHLLNRLQETNLKTSPVSIKVTAKKDEKLKIEMKMVRGRTTGEAESVVFEDDYIVQQAIKAPTTEEKIKTIIEKLGDTPYAAESVEVVADEDIFIPIGVLTNAKREAADMLVQKTIKGHKRELKNPQISDLNNLFSCQKEGEKVGSEVGSKLELEDKINATPENLEIGDTKAPLLSVEVKDVNSMFYAAEAGADIIYVPIEQFSELKGPTNEDKMKELIAKKEDGIEFVFIVPQITHDNELISLTPLIEEVKAAGFGISCSNLGAIQVAKTYDIPFVVQKELNTFNAFTASVFFDAGAHRVTLSSELNLDEIWHICENLNASNKDQQIEIVAHGRELLLVTENDLLKPLVDKRLVNSDNNADNGNVKGNVNDSSRNSDSETDVESDVLLVDKKERKFPVKRWGTRTLIYNFEVLNMLDDIDKLKVSGADVLRLDLRLNTKREVKEITQAYRDTLIGKDGRIRGQQGDVYTQGQYFRGV